MNFILFYKQYNIFYSMSNINDNLLNLASTNLTLMYYREHREHEISSLSTSILYVSRNNNFIRQISMNKRKFLQFLDIIVYVKSLIEYVINGEYFVSQLPSCDTFYLIISKFCNNNISLSSILYDCIYEFSIKYDKTSNKVSKPFYKTGEFLFIKKILYPINTSKTYIVVKNAMEMLIYDEKFWYDIWRYQPTNKKEAEKWLKAVIKKDKLTQILIKLPCNKRIVNNIRLCCPFLKEVL